MSELDYLYKYDPQRQAYVGRSPGAEAGSVVEQNRPFLIILQSENDVATGTFFPIGTGLFNIVNIRTHWDQVPVPGTKSDNSVAMLGALFRIQFPLTAGGMIAPPQPRLAPRAPDVQQLKQDKLR